jgi:hypothetical protein
MQKIRTYKREHIQRDRGQIIYGVLVKVKGLGKLSFHELFICTV